MLGVEHKSFRPPDFARTNVSSRFQNETCRKLSRRLGELEEQIQLDRQAKRDLEHSYALMLDEKDELITVLKTQVMMVMMTMTITSIVMTGLGDDMLSCFSPESHYY